MKTLMIVLALISVLCLIILLVIGIMMAYYKTKSLIFAYQYNVAKEKFGWKDKTPIGETNESQVKDQQSSGVIPNIDFEMEHRKGLSLKLAIEINNKKVINAEEAIREAKVIEQYLNPEANNEPNVLDQLRKDEGCDETYSHAQLVSFGKFLLSKERTDNLKANWDEGDSVLFEDRLREVYHSDLCNWRDKK